MTEGLDGLAQDLAVDRRFGSRSSSWQREGGRIAAWWPRYPVLYIVNLKFWSTHAYAYHTYRTKETASVMGLCPGRGVVLITVV